MSSKKHLNGVKWPENSETFGLEPLTLKMPGDVPEGFILTKTGSGGFVCHPSTDGVTNIEQFKQSFFVLRFGVRRDLTTKIGLLKNLKSIGAFASKGLSLDLLEGDEYTEFVTIWRESKVDFDSVMNDPRYSKLEIEEQKRLFWAIAAAKKFSPNVDFVQELNDQPAEIIDWEFDVTKGMSIIDIAQFMKSFSKIKKNASNGDSFNKKKQVTGNTLDSASSKSRKRKF